MDPLAICSASVAAVKLTFIVVVITFLSVATADRCPYDIFQAAFSCLGHMTGPHRQDLMAGGDVELLRQKCQDGSMTLSVSCIRDLLEDCARTSRFELLKKIASPVNMESSVRHICGHLDDYHTYSDCIAQTSTQIRSCISFRYTKYFGALKGVSSADKRFKLTCSFVHGVMECTEERIRAHCGDQPAELLIRFLSGINPPGCNVYQSSASMYYYNRASRTVSFYRHIFFQLLVVCMWILLMAAIS